MTLFASIDHLGLFIAAGILLNLTPGPDVLYIVTHSLRSGWRSGAVAALGITAGCFVHIVAATLGVSAVLAASSTAFSLLKWLGAAYLAYVGWTLLISGKQKNALNSIAGCAISTGATGQNHLKNVFIKGFWTNALNPKVALFFVAFLPQFIAPGAEHKTLAFLLLGLVFNFNGLWVNLGYAALGAAVSQRMASLQQALVWLQRAGGLLFIGFGLKLALTDNPPS
ncbi:LysE family translocator [Rhodoferax sp.]|uniref:LysE family translocator n=1 Tax=Rhodoferax sp. TaxID=50421 RepID=UPI00374CDA65